MLGKIIVGMLILAVVSQWVVLGMVDDRLMELKNKHSLVVLQVYKLTNGIQ